MQETQVQSLDQDDLLEKEMAIHSSILALEISWTEQSGVLQSMESQRVRHELRTKQTNNVASTLEGGVPKVPWMSRHLTEPWEGAPDCPPPHLFCQCQLPVCSWASH